MRIRPAFVVLAILAGFAGFAPHASAGPIEIPSGVSGCGFNAVDSGTYVLTGDVGPCTTDGITITGAKVTLDLSGFAVHGNATDNDATPGSEIGVDLFGTASQATIRNGSIDGFEGGIAAINNLKAKVTAVVVRDIVGVGVAIGGDKTSVDNAVVAGTTGSGIVLNGTQVNVTNSQVVGADELGIDIVGDSSTISGNDIAQSGIDGIAVFGADATISNNTSTSNGDNGIWASGAFASLTDNEVIANADTGMRLIGDGTWKVTGNRAHGNTPHGLDATALTGTVKSKDNKAFRNSIGACTPTTICDQPIVPEPAVALPASCGGEVTQPGTYVMTGDVGPCPSTGLQISASNVTLDLNGYSIVGDGIDNVMFVELGLSADGDRITIRNGSVTGFDTGIRVIGDKTRVSDVVAREHVNFGFLIGGIGLTIDRIAALEIGDGISLGGDGLKLTDSQVVDADDDGIEIGSSGAKVTGNAVVGAADDGVSVQAEKPKFSSNTVLDTGSAGFHIDQTESASLKNNNAVANGDDGFFLDGDDKWKLTGNDAHANLGDGIDASGVETIKAKNNRAFGNNGVPCSPSGICNGG